MCPIIADDVLSWMYVQAFFFFFFLGGGGGDWSFRGMVLVKTCLQNLSLAHSLPGVLMFVYWCSTLSTLTKCEGRELLHSPLNPKHFVIKCKKRKEKKRPFCLYLCSVGTWENWLKNESRLDSYTGLTKPLRINISFVSHVTAKWELCQPKDEIDAPKILWSDRRCESKWIETAGGSLYLKWVVV